MPEAVSLHHFASESTGGTWRARWGLSGLCLIVTGVCAWNWAIDRLRAGIDLADREIDPPPDPMMAVLFIGAVSYLLVGGVCLWQGSRRTDDERDASGRRRAELSA